MYQLLTLINNELWIPLRSWGPLCPLKSTEASVTSSTDVYTVFLWWHPAAPAQGDCVRSPWNVKNNFSFSPSLPLSLFCYCISWLSLKVCHVLQTPLIGFQWNDLRGFYLPPALSLGCPHKTRGSVTINLRGGVLWSELCFFFEY